MANKMTLVDAVAAAANCTKADAERAVEAIIDAVTRELKKGGEVSVAGLGIFGTRVRKARVGRNPRTGASVQIPEMRIPKFRPSKTLKDNLNS